MGGWGIGEEMGGGEQSEWCVCGACVVCVWRCGVSGCELDGTCEAGQRGEWHVRCETRRGTQVGRQQEQCYGPDPVAACLEMGFA